MHKNKIYPPPPPPPPPLRTEYFARLEEKDTKRKVHMFTIYNELNFSRFGQQYKACRTVEYKFLCMSFEMRQVKTSFCSLHASLVHRYINNSPR